MIVQKALSLIILLIKLQEQQQLLVQIIDIVNNFINNPLFAKYGPIGLFMNGVFSTFIPFPPEVTAISLIVGGISRVEILVILVTSWVIGAAIGYYAGFYGKKLATKGKSRDTDKTQQDFTHEANNALQQHNHEIYNSAHIDHDDYETNDGYKHSRYHQLLERYGWVIIFLSPWIPVLGDIIPLIAGAKGYEVKKFMIAISAGKVIRAVAVIFLGSYLASISTGPWIYNSLFVFSPFCSFAFISREFYFDQFLLLL
jgi:membrane protein YqaA with SNARE-associated domain